MFKLDREYQYKLKSMPRGRNSATPITNTCKVPYFSLTIDSNSNCFVCSCDGWLPIPVGHVQDFGSLDEVLNSSTAKFLQSDVDQKKFTWCAVEYCGIKNASIEPTTYSLLLNTDDSCNLACPSCRRDSIMHSAGTVYEEKLRDTNRILQWLEKFEHPIFITITGNGDPFASHIFRPLIQNYSPKPTQRIGIKTNGLLIKKQLSTSPLLPNIAHMSISVDAASKQVYEDVRRPGKWEVLLENFDYLVSTDLVDKTVLQFCLQNKNYADLPAFVELCNNYGFRGLVHQLDDWGTWNTTQVTEPDAWTVANGTYLDQNVLDPNHPNHTNMLKVLQVVKDSSSSVKIAPGLGHLLK